MVAGPLLMAQSAGARDGARDLAAGGPRGVPPRLKPDLQHQQRGPSERSGAGMSVLRSPREPRTAAIQAVRGAARPGAAGVALGRLTPITRGAAGACALNTRVDTGAAPGGGARRPGMAGIRAGRLG